MSGTSATTTPEEWAAVLRRVKWGVIVGTALEWFDFYLYSTMAAVVLGKVFFPVATSTTSTLAAFSTFTVGFLARPIGAMALGYLGDRIGRKVVLAITFMMMGTATGLIGLIPSYAAIGVAAPIILVALRILQGLGAGAEFAAANTTAYEFADEKSRGKQAAWPAWGTSAGLLAASLTITVLTSMDEGFVVSWGWRIPFVLSFVLLGVGFWVRRRMPETPEFEEIPGHEPGHPPDEAQPNTVRDLLTSNWRALLAVMIFTIGYLGSSYTFKTFSLAYMKEFLDVPVNVGTFGVALASAVGLFTIPLAGHLTDTFGYKKLMIVESAAIALIAFPFFWLIDTKNTLLIWTSLILASGIVIPMLLAIGAAFTAAQFPPHVRASGSGSAREIGAALSGGVAPLVALSLVTVSENHSTTGVSLMFVGAGVLVAVSALMDQHGRADRQHAAVKAKAAAAASS